RFLRAFMDQLVALLRVDALEAQDLRARRERCGLARAEALFFAVVAHQLERVVRLGGLIEDDRDDGERTRLSRAVARRRGLARRRRSLSIPVVAAHVSRPPAPSSGSAPARPSCAGAR